MGPDLASPGVVAALLIGGAVASAAIGAGLCWLVYFVFRMALAWWATDGFTWGDD